MVLLESVQNVEQVAQAEAEPVEIQEDDLLVGNRHGREELVAAAVARHRRAAARAPRRRAARIRNAAHFRSIGRPRHKHTHE